MSERRIRRTGAVLLLLLQTAAVLFSAACAGSKDSVTPLKADTFFSVRSVGSDTALQNTLVTASGFSQNDIVSFTMYPGKSGYTAVIRTDKEQSFLALAPDMSVRQSINCPLFGQSTNAAFLMPDGSFGEIVSDLSDGWDSTVQGRVIHADGSDEQFRMANLDKETIQSAKCTASGQILICTDRKVFIGSSFQDLTPVACQKNILGVCTGSDGQLYVWMQDKEGSELAVIDAAGKVTSIADFSSIPGLTGGIAGASEGFDKDLILFGTNGIYQYSPASKALTEAGSYDGSGLQVSVNPLPTSDGKGGILFYGAYIFGDSESGSGSFLVGNSVPSNPNRKIVTIGCPGSISHSGETLAKYFNMCQNEYTAELRYFETDDPSSTGGDARLRASVSTEDSPDVLLLYPELLQSFLQSDMLEPLDQKLFSNTSQNGNPEILANVRSAWTTDGTCRYIAPFFFLSGLITEDQYAEKLSNYTFSDLQNLAREENCAMFGNQTQAPIGALTFSIQNRFISQEDHSVSFGSPDFLEFLAFYKNLNDELEQNRGQNPKHIVIWRDLHSFRDFLNVSELYKTPVTMISFPDMETDAPLVLAPMYYAVSANAKEKEGAFAFLSFLLSSDVQSHRQVLSDGGMPVTETYFEDMITQDLQSYVPGSNGNSDGAAAAVSGIPDETLQAMPQVFRTLVAESDTTYLANGEVISLIYEELQPFMIGDKSAEETAKTIQNRMSVFIWETKS